MSLLLFNSLMGDLFFKLRHLNPKPTNTTQEILSVAEDPVQVMLTKDEATKISRRTDKNRVFNLLPQAKYSITGMLVAKNTNFFLRDVLHSDFDEICLIDFGLVWG